jgi:hypothetical protein
LRRRLTARRYSPLARDVITRRAPRLNTNRHQEFR